MKRRNFHNCFSGFSAFQKQPGTQALVKTKFSKCICSSSSWFQGHFLNGNTLFHKRRKIVFKTWHDLRRFQADIWACQLTDFLLVQQQIRFVTIKSVTGSFLSIISFEVEWSRGRRSWQEQGMEKKPSIDALFHTHGCQFSSIFKQLGNLLCWKSKKLLKRKIKWNYQFLPNYEINWIVNVFSLSTKSNTLLD